MPIINLNNRITSDSVEYEENKKSSRSLIFVEGDIQHDKCSGETLILTVGDHYFVNSQQVAIPKKGIVVKPGESTVICTQQHISTPLNVIGVIHGIGTNIYKNGFVSGGKIDQGFNGYLRIGFFNGGKRNITFRKNDVLACVVFHETEDTMAAAKVEQPYSSVPSYEMTRLDALRQFVSSNWISILSLILAIAALVVDIVN